MHINWKQVWALLVAQFRMDLRNPKTGKTRSSHIPITAASYGFSSLVLALSLRFQEAAPEPALFVALNFGMLLVAFAIISGYDILMGRPREYSWIIVLPASEQTHYMARLLNLLFLFGLIILSTILPVAVVMGPLYGAVDTVRFVGILALGMVWTTFIGISGFWLLMLITPYRFIKMATSVFQAVVILALVLGYQWVGSSSLDVPRVSWWPATWFVDLYGGNLTSGAALLLASLAYGLLLFLVYFPPRFIRLMLRLVDGEREAEFQIVKPSRLAKLEALWIRQPQAWAAYRFAVSAFWQDNVVRRRLYLAILLPGAFALFGWWTGGLHSIFEVGVANMLSNPGTQMHMSLLVILFFACQSLLQAMQLSDTPEASWVFDTLPVQSMRVTQMAAQQALTARLLVPLFIGLTTLLCLMMSPLHALIHAGFWFVACVFVMRVQVIFYRRPPFSRKADRFSVSERFLPLLLSIPLALVFTTIQLVTFITPGVAALCLLLFVAINAGLVKLVHVIGQPSTPRPMHETLFVNLNQPRPAQASALALPD